jgi:hypothetical protein
MEIILQSIPQEKERAKMKRILQNSLQEKERSEWRKYCRIFVNERNICDMVNILHI